MVLEVMHLAADDADPQGEDQEEGAEERGLEPVGSAGAGHVDLHPQVMQRACRRRRTGVDAVVWPFLGRCGRMRGPETRTG